MQGSVRINPMPSETYPAIKTVKKVMPAVVSIIISKARKDVEREFLKIMHEQGQAWEGPGPLPIPPEKIDKHGMVQVGGGSGFIVDASGIILTNKHVISEPHAQYTIILNDNSEYPAEVLARDPLDDVAILRIHPKEKLPTVALGNSDRLDLGQPVLAIGNALGLFKNTVSMGIVSGLSRAISAQADPESVPQEMRGLIQTDAAINPGNSGGPLVNLSGEAIGINAAVVFGAQNINFAIPIRAAERDLRDLKQFGRIRRPLLGLRYLIVTPNIKHLLPVTIEYGAFVTKEHPLDKAIVPGSPAHKAGIKENDIILAWGGKKIDIEHTIQDYLETSEVGEKVVLTVLRRGKTSSIPVTLTERK